MKLLNQILNQIESSKFNLRDYSFSLAFILFVRLLLENLSSGTGFEFGSFGKYMGLHSVIWFICLKLSLALVLSIITKIPILKTLNTLLILFPVIWIAPSIDIINSQGLGNHMTYLHVQSLEESIQVFIRFMQSDHKLTTATIGLTIEVAIILLGIGFYVFLKTKNIIKSFISIFISYLIIFLFAIYPFMVDSFFALIQVPADMSSEGFGQLSVFSLLVIFYLLLITVFYGSNSKQFKLIIKDIRPLRILHYLTVFILGVSLLFPRYRAEIDALLLSKLIVLFFSFVFAVVYAIVVNNIEDIEIDKVSNKERPLVKGVIEINKYKEIGTSSFIISAFSSLFCGFYNFYFLMLFSLAYYVYSTNPIKLKRVPILSKMLIGFISFSVSLWGFLFFSTDGVDAISRYPYEYALFFIVSVGLMANFIDLKDVEGDKKTNIKTLPVILGLKKSKRIISLFFILGFTHISFLVNKPIVFYLLPISLIPVLYFLNKTNYQEKYVFIFYILSLLGMSIIIWSINSPFSPFFDIVQ